MHNKNHLHIIVTAITLLISACSNVDEVDSDDIATSDMWAKFAVHSTDDNSSTATAELLLGDSHSRPYITLSESDTLQVLLNSSNAQTMTKSANQNSYQAMFNTTNAGKSAFYRFQLNRTNHVDATNSSISLPTPVSNINFNPENSFSRNSENITVTWDPLDDSTISITASGECVNTKNYNIQDTGSLNINAFELNSKSGFENTNCDLTFTFSREKTGSVDTAFGEGGEISATSVREATISTTP